MSGITKKALVLVANGVEEIETVIAIDVLRRAGITVTVAGVDGPDVVECSRQVRLVPDVSLAQAVGTTHDLVVLPGGQLGAKAFVQSSLVGDLLRSQEKGDRFIGAICAAPTALKAHGVYLGKRITSYPLVKDELIEGGQYVYSEEAVVQDGPLTTSRGPGTTFQFALALVKQLVGEERAISLAKLMLIKV